MNTHTQGYGLCTQPHKPHQLTQCPLHTRLGGYEDWLDRQVTTYKSKRGKHQRKAVVLKITSMGYEQCYLWAVLHHSTSQWLPCWRQDTHSWLNSTQNMHSLTPSIQTGENTGMDLKLAMSSGGHYMGASLHTHTHTNHTNTGLWLMHAASQTRTSNSHHVHFTPG